MEEKLLSLVDGGIFNISADTDYTRGCITCDWGSCYVREYQIELQTAYLTIKAEEEYTYPLSEGYMMKLFLGNAEHIQTLTEKEFFTWLETTVEKDLSSDAEVSCEWIDKV